MRPPTGDRAPVASGSSRRTSSWVTSTRPGGSPHGPSRTPISRSCCCASRRARTAATPARGAVLPPREIAFWWWLRGLPARDRVALAMAIRHGWAYDDDLAVLLDEASAVLGRPPHEAPASVTAALERRLGALPPRAGDRSRPAARDVRVGTPRARSPRSSCSPPRRDSARGRMAATGPGRAATCPAAAATAGPSDRELRGPRRRTRPAVGPAGPGRHGGQRPPGRADRWRGPARAVGVRRCGPCCPTASARRPAGRGRHRAGRRRPDRAPPCTP